MDIRLEVYATLLGDTPQLLPEPEEAYASTVLERCRQPDAYLPLGGAGGSVESITLEAEQRAKDIQELYLWLLLTRETDAAKYACLAHALSLQLLAPAPALLVTGEATERLQLLGASQLVQFALLKPQEDFLDVVLHVLAHGAVFWATGFRAGSRVLESLGTTPHLVKVWRDADATPALVRACLDKRLAAARARDVAAVCAALQDLLKTALDASCAAVSVIALEHYDPACSPDMPDDDTSVLFVRTCLSLGAARFDTLAHVAAGPDGVLAALRARGVAASAALFKAEFSVPFRTVHEFLELDASQFKSTRGMLFSLAFKTETDPPRETILPKRSTRLKDF
jgi:hypothetical protein